MNNKEKKIVFKNKVSIVVKDPRDKMKWELEKEDPPSEAAEEIIEENTKDKEKKEFDGKKDI